MPSRASRIRLPSSCNSAFRNSSSARLLTSAIRACNPVKRPVIMSGTNSGARTRNSRPFRKSQADSITAKNPSSSSTSSAANRTPIASRMIVKSPLRVRAL